MKAIAGKKVAAFSMLLCVIAAGDGFAADLPVAPPAPFSYAPPSQYNWSGLYFGVNAGYGTGQTSWANALQSTANFNINGALVGGTIGINYQAGAFVVGFEADGDWAGFQESNSSDPYCAAFTASCETKAPWLGTVRGRIGFAIDRLLIFGTAGGAFGEIKAGLSPPGLFDVTNGFGWTAGGGVEAGITENWTAKIEYLHVDLGNGSCNLSCGAIPTQTGGSTPIPNTVPLTENLVRGGINYRFAF
jgi:outer membrane immunogenic protein